jgi:hypothetical protein
MMTADTVSGVQVVDSPLMPPGCCFLTGRADGPLVDTLVDIEVETPPGRIYISRQVVFDMAAAFGCIPPARAAELLTDLEDAQVECAAAKSELAELRHWRDAVLSQLETTKES